MTDKIEKVWFNDLSILLDKDKLAIFFPNSEMTLNEKLNSIMRLSIYISLSLFLIKRNYRFLFIPLVMGSLSYMIIKFKPNRETFPEVKTEDKKNELKIIESTKENPFMNILLNEYEENPNREAEIKEKLLENNEIKEKIEDNFNNNLYKNVSDIYGSMHSQRQYYTNPITTIPNDQKGFAEWCYKVSEKTCKEGNGLSCMKNNYEPLYGNSRNITFN